MSVKKTILTISFLLGPLLSGAFAQIGSTNYKVLAGYAVGGGGSSGSAGYLLMGNVPLTASGLATSSGYILNGGVGAAIGASSFSATYFWKPIDSISAANITLKVAHFGASGTVTGNMYYRPGGATNYTAVAMTAGTGDTMTAPLPEAALNPRGSECYFVLSATNGSTMVGSPTSPYIIVAHMTNAQARYALPNTSHRIIGVPIGITGDRTVTTVFADDLGAYNNTQWRLASFDNATSAYLEFPNADPVVPGRGYWIIGRGTKSFGAQGYSNRPNQAAPYIGGPRTYEVALDSGWNLLANPFAFQIRWDDLYFDDNGAIIDLGSAFSAVDTVAYGYNGTQYVHLSNVPGWNGFFIFAKKNGVSVLFPYSQYPIASPPRLAANLSADKIGDGWSLHFQVEANGRIDDGNFAGVASTASAEADGYDFYEPPAAPEAPSLAFRLPGNDKTLRRADIRPVFADGAEWTIKLSPMGERTLRITGRETLPENMTAILRLDNGSEIFIEENMSFVLADGIEAGRLIIGTKEYLEGEGIRLLPTVFALEQNYPNPFNPSTTIKFALPENGHVALEIYNILGQRVTSLVNRELPAGYHTIAWDGTDSDKRAVASGIYFYKITSGSFAQNRKMVLLK